MIRTACVFVGTLAVASPALAGGCHVDRFSAIYGQDTDVRMVTKSSLPCNIRMRSGSVVGITISGSAHHGTAALVSDKIIYTPAPGFTGSDQFVFEKYGEAFVGEQGRHIQGTSHYTVNVEVSP